MDPKTIHVNMLGDFSLSCGDIKFTEKDTRSYRGKCLLAYLIYHRESPIPTSQIIHVLGIEELDGLPVATLRTMLYRVRQATKPLEEAAGAPLIITGDGSYRWNPDIPVIVDVEELQQFRENWQPDAPDAIDSSRAVLSLYQGDFLRNFATEFWVEPLSEYYRNLYLSQVEFVAEKLMASGQYAEAEQHCTNAVRISPYRESIYRKLMIIKAARGNRREALDTFEELRATLYKDLGVKPEDETIKTYNEIQISGRDYYITREELIEKMHEPDMSAGPIVCEFNVFTALYRSEARSVARRGDAIHIAIFSLKTKNGDILPPRSLEVAMSHLLDQLKNSLRSGDVVSKCSPSQYVVMLLQSNFENAEKVGQRIDEAFRRAAPRSPAQVGVNIFPLDPPEELTEGLFEKSDWKHS